jgi:hypothetical protein
LRLARASSLCVIIQHARFCRFRVRKVSLSKIRWGNQRHKYELYTIAGPIIGIIYDLNKSNWETVVELASKINTKLVEWFDRLPMELKLESHIGLDMSALTEPEVEVCELFHLQALVLQLAYDNIQIILHRLFLQYGHRLIVSSGSHSSDARPTSFEQCKHCAQRTCSILPKRAKVLLAAQDTHAAAYIVIQNFTAGVILGMVALSDPGSEQSSDAKRGIANSISLKKTHAKSSVVASQMVRILEGLFQLVFKRKMQTLLGNLHLETSSPRPQNRKSGPETYGGLKHPDSHNNSHFNQASVNQDQEITKLLSSNISTQNVPCSSPEMNTLVGCGLGLDTAGLPFYSAVDEALDSVQQGMGFYPPEWSLSSLKVLSAGSELNPPEIILLMQVFTVLWENANPIAYTGNHISPMTGPHLDAFPDSSLPQPS